ncbi:ABC transporter [Salinisphaera sp. T31B1]
MERDIKLCAQGLARDYAGRRVVDGIDIELAAGEVLGMLGPNGAGKSTTLRMLAGTLAPSAGRVSLNGHDLAEDARTAKQGLGYLPERPPLYPELTVDEYLSFCAAVHGVPRADRRRAIDAARADCGLEDTGRRPIGHLSKGFQQRVGIAQAIVHRPDVLILDEPTAGLDPNQLRGVRALVARLAARHSVILSSHMLSEIQAVATRVLIVHQGRVVYDAALARHGDGDTVELLLGASPAREALLAITGVVDATALGSGRWRLAVAPGHDVRATLVDTAVARGWQLLELTRRAPSLEERFAALTSGSERHAPEAAA